MNGDNLSKNIMASVMSLFLAFIIAKVLRIGPVIFVISEKRGMGVHSGDFLAFIPLGIAALYVYRNVKKP